MTPSSKTLATHALIAALVGLLMVSRLTDAGPAAHGRRFSPPASGAHAVQPVTQTIIVSITDKNGAPVTGMQAADLEIKVAGKAQEVVSADPSTVPLRIALVVADAGTGVFQFGLQRLMQRLAGHAELSLTSVVVQPEKLIDFSADSQSWGAGLRRVGSRGMQQQGAQLIEAIHDAATDIASETRRPIIIVMRVGGEATSSLSGSDVREQLRKSGAALYVLSTRAAEGRATSSPSPSVATDPRSQQSVAEQSETIESASNLGQVLGDGSKESGGRYERIVATAMASSFERLGDELLHQYQVTYTARDGLKAGDKISVSSKRKGVTVRAASRVRR